MWARRRLLWLVLKKLCLRRGEKIAVFHQLGSGGGKNRRGSHHASVRRRKRALLCHTPVVEWRTGSKAGNIELRSRNKVGHVSDIGGYRKRPAVSTVGLNLCRKGRRFRASLWFVIAVQFFVSSVSSLSS